MANKTKYKVRHIACNMNDFLSDIHRFRFEYAGETYVVHLVSKSGVVFEGTADQLPETVRDEVIEIIYEKADKEEFKWRYPQEAYNIADRYVKEEFTA